MIQRDLGFSPSLKTSVIKLRKIDKGRREKKY